MTERLHILNLIKRCLRISNVFCICVSKNNCHIQKLHRISTIQNNPNKSSCCCCGCCCDCAGAGIVKDSGAAATVGEVTGNIPAPTFPGGPAAIPPNIDTKSSRGLLDVPANRAAGALSCTCVAAKPNGWPALSETSSKSRRFSACCPATTVCRAFCVENRSSVVPLYKFEQ